MSTLLLNHAAINDINSSQNTSSATGGLGGCLGGVRVSRDALGGLAVGSWPRTDYTEADACVMPYDTSSAAVVAAARFMQGYRNHHHYQHTQQPAMLPSNSLTSTSSG